MELLANTVDNRFDRTIDQLNDQNKQETARQKGTLQTVITEPDSRRDENQADQEFLSKGLFVAHGRTQT
jgi:predicted Abi (CAAX) family protease